MNAAGKRAAMLAAGVVGATVIGILGAIWAYSDPPVPAAKPVAAIKIDPAPTPTASVTPLAVVPYSTPPPRRERQLTPHPRPVATDTADADRATVTTINSW